MRNPKRFRQIGVVSALAALAAVGAFVAQDAIASDHQQTALTELNPQLDINDVYAFPGSSDDRIAIVVTVASPIVGTRNARFDPNALYQIKVDNNQDGREDVVMQFSFDELAAGGQTVDVIGPVAPRPATGEFPSAFSEGGVRDRFATQAPTIRRGATGSTVSGTIAGAAAGQNSMQVFAGLRDDPFFVDLPQFFRILPDRRPTEGPLSLITRSANSFRASCDAQGNFTAGQNAAFDRTRGCATDFLQGFNAMAIVVELPESALMRSATSTTPGGTGATGANAQLGIWATVSR